jgi:endonuclease/exonuclease/phosphatase family metal-dependent hydrolase
MILVVYGILVSHGLIAYADSGRFSTLTYNIADLPQIVSSAESDRREATELISCYINDFDVVNVQEDFNYHAVLYNTCNDHPYRSPTSGGAGFGSGLNSLSRFSYMDWVRVKWNKCNGVDCLTPKGFTMARTRLSEGVYVDIYNLHAQAAVGQRDLAVRRANILQLAAFIEENSAGNAVIVMGDTNTRYTRAEDNMWELLNRGFTDVWVSRVRGGDVPAAGAAALVCTPPVTSADCEVVDKILYRDNGYVGLTAEGYQIREDAYNDKGEELSDHRPIQVDWTYGTDPDRRLSDQIGGPYGVAFNDVGILPENPSVASLGIRSGDRIDRVEITLTDGVLLSHGGTGGEKDSFSMESGEYLTSLHACSSGKKDNGRISYARFTTSTGRTLEGGTETSDCETYIAPDGWQIVGFHGRSGDEIDKIGVIYAPY